MQHSRYHKFLRVSIVVVALVLVFDSGFLTPVSRQLSDSTINYLGNAVGVYVGVEDTELSLWTAELTSRERDIAEREAALNAREISTRDFGDGSANIDYSTYILSTILFILMVLIVLNYAMDITRAKKIERHEGQPA